MVQNFKHFGIRGRIENIEYLRTSTYMKMHRQQCRVHGIDYSTVSTSSLYVFDMLSSSCGNYCAHQQQHACCTVAPSYSTYPFSLQLQRWIPYQALDGNRGDTCIHAAG